MNDTDTFGGVHAFAMYIAVFGGVELRQSTVDERIRLQQFKSWSFDWLVIFNGEVVDSYDHKCTFKTVTKSHADKCIVRWRSVDGIPL